MGRDRDLVGQAADLVFFAPLGLALEARQLIPELAARGRRQLLFTRTVGKYAVRRGRHRVDALVGTGTGLVTGLFGSSSPEPDRYAEAAATAPVRLRPVSEPGPDSDHLAIPDYDSLSAFQVVPRLEALDPGDLAAVKDYEEATRGRRTILNKIAQLS
jgi:hypothetical protein